MPTIVDLDHDKLPFIKAENTPRFYTLCNNGDIAFADASEDTNDVAKAVEFKHCYNKKIVCGLHTIHGRDNNDSTIVGYKGYAFASSAFHKQVRRIAQGTKIYSINTKNFSELFIGVPSKLEQEKISTLLIAIDTRIATQNKIIEKLQSLIKGLNDDIQNSIDGELVCFSDLGKAYSGLGGKAGNDFGNGKPFVTYMNVYHNTYVSNKEFGLVKIIANERQNCVRYGDALFTLSSETPEEVGMGAIYLGNEEELFLNSFCFGVHFNDIHHILPQYIAYLISSTNFRKSVYSLAQGSTRFNLQKNDFMHMRFRIPKLEYQRNIAEILDNISNNLAIERQLLQLYTQQKQYLLHQMFI